jgi:hypothetical protein
MSFQGNFYSIGTGVANTRKTDKPDPNPADSN